MSGKPYGQLSVPEKWQWHAEIYAYRRVALGIAREERISPCDLDGAWFDERMVDEAERKLRAERTVKQVSRRKLSDTEMTADGRDVSNNWARQQGYLNLRDYMKQLSLDYENDRDYAKACLAVSTSIIAASVMKNKASSRTYNPNNAARDLGVKATEFKPTAEQLRAARIALGLEQSEAVE